MRRNWWSSNGYIAKTRDHLPQIEAPVETITKLGKIPVKIFLADCMKGTAQRVFDVTNDGVDPIELWNLYTFRSATGNNHGMIMPGLLNGRETAQPIGDYVATRRKMASRPVIDGF